MKNYSQNNKSLQKLVEEPAAMYHINMSRAGLAMSFLHAFIEYSKISIKELAAIFQVSERTIQRYQSDTKLPSGPSEKLILLTQLYDSGSNILGSTASFRQWLHTPNASLGGAEPMQLLDTHMGFELVKETLERLSQGVYS